MSCTLYWMPVVEDKNYISDFVLRNILEKKYGFKTKLSYGDIPYLEGLVDGNHPDAQEIIDAIHKYETIIIGQEC